MNEAPVIELRIKDMGEAVNAAILLHHQEVEGYIRAGIEQATSTMAQHMIEFATKEAREQITERVKDYFLYGPGGEAIKMAVERALEPMLKALQAYGVSDERP